MESSGTIAWPVPAVVAGTIVGLFVLFHILVIAGVVPRTIVWGGRITDRSRLIVMEIVSIISLLAYSAVVYVVTRSGMAGDTPHVILRVAMWAFVALFLLNTLGNVVAVSPVEKSFALITGALAVVTALMAIRM